MVVKGREEEVCAKHDHLRETTSWTNLLTRAQRMGSNQEDSHPVLGRRRNYATWSVCGDDPVAMKLIVGKHLLSEEIVCRM